MDFVAATPHIYEESAVISIGELVVGNLRTLMMAKLFFMFSYKIEDVISYVIRALQPHTCEPRLKIIFLLKLHIG